MICLPFIDIFWFWRDFFPRFSHLRSFSSFQTNFLLNSVLLFSLNPYLILSSLFLFCLESRHFICLDHSPFKPLFFYFGCFLTIFYTSSFRLIEFFSVSFTYCFHKRSIVTSSIIFDKSLYIHRLPLSKFLF